MDKNLIAKLQKAGVGSDVILALIMDDEQAAPEAAAPETEAQESAQPEAPAAEQPAATPQPDPILEAINKLTGAIQASNIINAGAAGRPQQVTVDDVMAKIIQPQAPGKE